MWPARLKRLAKILTEFKAGDEVFGVARRFRGVCVRSRASIGY